MLLYEVAVRIDFKLRFFAVGINDYFVVPLSVRVVFPHYFGNVPASRLVLDGFLDGRGE